MNHLLQLFRLPLCLGLVLTALAARGQNITAITNNTGGLVGLPNAGMVGDQIYIWGNNFFTGTLTNVSFNGVRAITYGVLGMNVIQANIPNGASGTGPVTIKFNTGVTASSPASFTILPTGPYVRSFSPTSGDSNTTVTIRGAKLVGLTDVRFNGVTVRSLVYGPGVDEINVLPPVAVTTGPIAVVSNAVTHTTTSNFFAAPLVTGFSPTFGRSGTNVVIVGTNLSGVTEVLFNGQGGVFTVNHNGQITATVPVGATTGKLNVYGPGGNVLTSSNFVVRPTIFSFTPNVGRAGTNVIITGANLNEGTSAVRFGTNTASFTVNNATQITAIVPNAAVTSLISVTTTNGSHTNGAYFHLPPRITTFSSSNAPVGSTITINGTNFIGTSAVLFNGVAAANILNVSNFSLQAVVPAGFVTGPVSVTTPAGTTNSPGAYFAAPIITSFTPTHGLPGTNVFILGSSFSNASVVAFGGVPAMSFTVLSNAGVRATVPVGALSGSISLTAPAGTAISAGSFLLDSDIPVPALTAGLNLSGQIQLAWPTNIIPFTLQASTDLTSPLNWANVLTSPAVVGISNVVTEPANAASKFYRLKK